MLQSKLDPKKKFTTCKKSYFINQTSGKTHCLIHDATETMTCTLASDEHEWKQICKKMTKTSMRVPEVEW